MTEEFKTGDIVVKRCGKKPARVIGKHHWYNGHFECEYLHNNSKFAASADDLKHYEGDLEPVTQTKTLYSFTLDGKICYGTHIGTNSQNQYLIEEKGTGQIRVFDKKDLEEVLPYTFSAKMGNSENHYVGTPGSVQKDDILLYTGSGRLEVAVVTAVDTKSKTARGKFKGVKLSTAPL